LKNVPDLSLLKLFQVKSNYDNYIEYVKKDILEYEIRTLLTDFGKYYKEHDNNIEINDFATWFNHYAHPDLPDSQREVFKSIFEAIPQVKMDATNTVLTKFQEYSTTKAVRHTLEKGFNLESLQKLLEDHEILVKAAEDEDEAVIKNDLNSILQTTRRSEGLKWRLDCLNKSIGPLSKGMFVIVSAYVDVGKTALCISEASYMAQQLKEGCILWLNNEEEDHRVYKKIWKSTLGVKEENLLKAKDRAREEYVKRMHGDIERIKFVNIRKKSFNQITKLIKKYNPSLCIIDQVDKIEHSYKAFSDHDRLKSLYGKVRDLANEYCAVIAVSQADVTTTYRDRDTGDVQYQLYPHHRQLDGSKVGKPGEADAIVMIGRKLEHPGSRGIHVSKNKFGDTIKQEVIFDGEICRYTNP
jgi:wyosine [tRNA(Phe)-imidazoG37] synthetase (radical SAM superfamily)